MEPGQHPGFVKEVTSFIYISLIISDYLIDLSTLKCSALVPTRYAEYVTKYAGQFSTSAWLYVSFDDKTRLRDLVHNAFFTNFSSAQLVTNQPGPFDIPQSSYTVSRSQCCGLVAQYSFYPQTNFPSFTISFYWQTNGLASFGIFHESQSESEMRLSLISNGLNLDIVSHYAGGTSSKVSAGAVFSPNQWKFVSITYDRPNRRLTVYDDRLTLVTQKNNFNVEPGRSSNFKIGYAVDSGSHAQVTMSPSAAIACFSIFSDVLSGEQLAGLPCLCEIKPKPNQI